MLSLIAFVSLSAFAKSENLNTYTYQARLVGSTESCQTEAQNWASRFEKATGLNTVNGICRTETDVVLDNQSYKIYLLGLTYRASQPYTPYVAELGSDDLASYTRLNTAVYPNIASCLADLETQTVNFEENTGLVAVSASCQADRSAIDSRHVLRIEGFSKKPLANPAKRLYRFSPFSVSQWDENRSNEIRNFLNEFGVTIVKETSESFHYYRKDGAVPARGQRLAEGYTQAECELQIRSAQKIIEKAGSEKSSVWCADKQLFAIWSGTYYLNTTPVHPKTTYATIEQCLNDREFVLSDSQNRNAAGALCSRSFYESNAFEMSVVRISPY